MEIRNTLCGIAVCLLSSLVFAAVVSHAAEEEKPPRIMAEDARQHVGRKVEVVFEVKGSKNSVKRKTVFLDSEADFNDRKNLGVAISEQGVTDLKKVRNVEVPEEFYRGKMIRIIGVVVDEDDRIYITVNEAEQLDLAKTESER